MAWPSKPTVLSWLDQRANQLIYQLAPSGLTAAPEEAQQRQPPVAQPVAQHDPLDAAFEAQYDPLAATQPTQPAASTKVSAD